MVEINMDMLPRLTEDLIFREEEDEQLIIYNPKTDNLHVVSGLGRDFIQSCNGELSIRAIMKKFSVKRPDLLAEYSQGLVKQFVQDLINRGVLVWEH